MTTITFDKREFLNQSVKTVATIAGMVLLPFLVHLIPFSGSAPLGAFLLPMFIAPMAAAFYLSPAGLVAAAIIAPLLNHVFTGMPTVVVLPQLIFEVAIFSLILALIIKKKAGFAGMASMAFVSAKLITFALGIFAASSSFNMLMLKPLITGLLTALPGLVILFILERYLVKEKN